MRFVFLSVFSQCVLIVLLGVETFQDICVLTEVRRYLHATCVYFILLQKETFPDTCALILARIHLHAQFDPIKVSGIQTFPHTCLLLHTENTFIYSINVYFYRTFMTGSMCTCIYYDVNYILIPYSNFWYFFLQFACLRLLALVLC